MDEILGAGRFTRLVCRDGWEFLDQPGLRGIVVLVAVADARLLLVEQWRAPLNARVIELPAGMVGDVAGEEAESFESAAQRELLEETGYRAGRLERLFEGTMSPGRTSLIYTFYRAADLTRVHDGGGDEHEDIVVHAVPVGGVEAWLKKKSSEGILVDAKIFAGLHFLNRKE